MIIVRLEEADLRWATVNRRGAINNAAIPTWWGAPQAVDVGDPFLIAIVLWELALRAFVDEPWVTIFPFLAEPPGYGLSGVFQSQELLDRLVGAWWFLGLFVVNAIFNTILGEEFLFRGVLLPKMEGAFGRWSWVANGAMHGFYHLHRGASQDRCSVASCTRSLAGATAPPGWASSSTPPRACSLCS